MNDENEHKVIITQMAIQQNLSQVGKVAMIVVEFGDVIKFGRVNHYETMNKTTLNTFVKL